MKTIKPFNSVKKYFSIFFTYAAIGCFHYSCAPVPKLTKTDKKTIKEVLRAPIPIIIKGETGFAKSEGHSIWYEKISPEIPIKGTVLLIMGNGQDALSWPPSFILDFTDVGYQVIRYDHRGTGLSTSKEKWKKKNPYTLLEMAEDAIAVLDAAKIEKAHIVGVSMGGMIAQLIAIEHPERTNTLTSIMSSGDVIDSELPPMSDEILPKMISAVLNHGLFGSKKGQIKRQIIQKRILMAEATGEIDVKTMAEVAYYNLEAREGYNIMAARAHYAAILNSEPRLGQLLKLKVPTLIIHGMQDPVMPLAHGKKLVATIPNADSLWIENMGHDIPDWAIEKMVKTMTSTFEKVTN